MFLWAQMGHGAAQLHDAACVATILNHRVDARGAQARMLLESLADEPDVGIDHRGAQRLRAVEALALDGVAYGIGVDAQFTGDRAYFPMFGVEIAPYFRAGFQTDHKQTSPSLWNAWIGINEASNAPANPAAGREPRCRRTFWSVSLSTWQ